MTLSFPLEPVNGQQLVNIPGGAVGSHMLYLIFAGPPSAGTVTVEWRRIGSTAWRPLQKVINRAIPAVGLEIRIDGPMAELRVTFAGLVGGTLPRLWLDANQGPEKLYQAEAAMTVQNFTEGNVKKGVQYELATYNPALPALGFTDYLVVTGAKPISIKGRVLQFDGAGLVLETYEGPTYTGGVLVPYYNLNFRNPVPGLVQIYANMTVSNIGVQKASHKRLLGSTGQGNSVLTSASKEVDGLETILDANKTYLFRTVSLSANSAQRVASFATWYEGDLDLPL